MKITEDLLIGRRAVDELKECSLIQDWKWDENFNVWYFKFSLLNKNKGDFPAITNWCLTAEGNYPNGKIGIYPSVNHGITNTYFHQSNNGLTSKNNIWREGKLCLEVQGVAEGIFSNDEPKDSYARILWHLTRAVNWINKASTGTLIGNNQWLELPDFKTNNFYKVISSEDIVSEMIWNDCEYNSGYANMYILKDDILIIKEYMSRDGNVANTYKWGKSIEEEIASQEPIKAIWIRMKSLPVINGWQAPNTWYELKKALKEQGMDLIKMIRKLSPNIRDKKRHFLLIGFPFQEKVGQDRYIYQWKSIFLPTLSFGEGYANGFRKNELGWFENDKRTIYRDENRLEWTRDENWSAYSSLLRGRYDTKVRQSKYLIIGAGTLSAYLCEQLVRNGVEDITILDDDFYKIGNNSRHILHFKDVDSIKSEALAKMLNNINPHARIKSIKSKLDVNNITILNQYNVIIDCSANDEVIFNISEHKQNCKGIIFSVSFGFKADNLYLYCCDMQNLIYRDYKNFFFEEINKDRNNMDFQELPQDGIGCWSPAFPAFTSDVMLASATATSIINNYITNNDNKTRGFIYKKKYNKDGYFIGYEESNAI
ncbi:ThiF family adenylyltransferase [Tissierella sp.]|uniref:HesA/MoeB/ThiF family protein n=1 Tax=Tissierella sp. TaxID=41274 RepID=UPI0028B1809E|nr:ThiF family adenylyltransferase [Tissierella sp.]